jgi:hypothetical protein
VVRDLIAELGVDVDGVEVRTGWAGLNQQRRADEDVVQDLAVALEDVGAALVLRDEVPQVHELQALRVGPALEHLHGLREVEVVEVAERDDARRRVDKSCGASETAGTSIVL